MTSILISLPAEQMANILNGEQTIIIMKTKPKCDLPIDVYGYCKEDGLFLAYEKHIDEYVIYKDKETARMYGNIASPTTSLCAMQNYGPATNGHVLAKFTLKNVYVIHDFLNGFEATEPMYRHVIVYDEDELSKESCLSKQQIEDYGGSFVWQVSDLQIFHEPKEITEFYEPHECGELPMPITKAPSSWRYVEASQ